MTLISEELSKRDNLIKIEFHFKGEDNRNHKDFFMKVVDEIPYGVKAKIKIRTNEEVIEKKSPYFGDTEKEIFKALIEKNIEEAEALIVLWKDKSILAEEGSTQEIKAVPFSY